MRESPQELDRLGYDVEVEEHRNQSGVQFLVPNAQIELRPGIVVTASMTLTSPPSGGITRVCIFDRRVPRDVASPIGVGRATCSPKDEWDPDFGFMVAYGRAYVQAFGR